MGCIIFGDGLWATKCLERPLDERHDIAVVVLRREPSDETLRRELGVAPDAETQALAAEIARPVSAEEAHGAARPGAANGAVETAGSRERPPHPITAPPVFDPTMQVTITP